MLMQLRKIHIVMSLLLVLSGSLAVGPDPTPTSCVVEVHSEDNALLENDGSLSVRMTGLMHRARGSMPSRAACGKVAGGVSCLVCFFLFTSRLVFALLDTAHQ